MLQAAKIMGMGTRKFTRNINTVSRLSRSNSGSSSGSGINENRVSVPSINSNGSGFNSGGPPNFQPNNGLLQELMARYDILKSNAYRLLDEAYTTKELIEDYLADGAVQMVRFSLGELQYHTTYTIGVVPLNSAIDPNSIQYTGLFRSDCLIHGDYTIFMSGHDTSDYWYTFTYLLESIGHLDSIKASYLGMLRIENEIIQNNLGFLGDSLEISDAVNNLISVLNTLV